MLKVLLEPEQQVGDCDGDAEHNGKETCWNQVVGKAIHFLDISHKITSSTTLVRYPQSETYNYNSWPAFQLERQTCTHPSLRFMSHREHIIA